MLTHKIQWDQQFLECLHNLYCLPAYAPIRELIADRLKASQGGTHPAVNDNANVGLDELRDLWGHSWAVLWGPPGTGKTYTLGKQVAACLDDPTERILIVSTTNKATDEAALSIGRAARMSSISALEEGKLLRIGKGVDYDRFQNEHFEDMLRGTETELLLEISRLSRRLQETPSNHQKALYQQRLQALRRMMKDKAFQIFLSPNVRVVISTAFKAVSLLSDQNLRSSIAEGKAPFTTVIIDEAGLISRAATAALSLLAARRVLIVGDVKQLAPISKISKVLPMTQATWLARSSLSHLQQMEPTNKAVHLLREQYRMHPQIRRAVSDYQYDDSLQDSAKVVERDFPLPAIQRNQPRAIWYVLDEDKDLSLPSIRAERGPGNRSWVRNATTRVLGKLFSDPEIGQQRGLFLSPFKAQAKAIAHFLKGWPNWSAATIHSQQGAEADIVIFDTVNAGSTGWSYEDWKRLINVGISRAKECVLLLASRAEMNQPYLNPLSQNLAPRILTVSRGKSAFHDVALQPAATTVVDEGQSDLLGVQIARRKALRPVLSAEQQQLIGRTLDEGPRLVRGVAGSGKTVVLAHWLVQTLHKLGHETGGPIWAVFANKSLEGLIRETIEDAWKSKGDSGPFPWHKVSLLHIKDILQPRLSNVGLNINAFDFNWDEAAKSYLQCIPAGQNGPCCRAIFIDEAQDMGPNALKLLVAFVEKSDPNDPNSRAVNIFYDNAQNIFGRPRPTWTEIGLNMTGRSTIMKESFRSTKPIAEFALNVLYRLQPPQADPDHQELIKLGLIEKCTRDDKDWWDVRFNQVNGPRPIYDPDNISLDQEMEELGNQLVRWIRDEAVKPRDICIIYNDGYIGWRLGNQVAPKLKAIGVELLVQTSQSFTRDDRTILATTPHSFKGYDSEIIVIAAADKFVARNVGILANNLYVAMTRAKSVLAIYARSSKNKSAQQLLGVLDECLNPILERPEIEKEISRYDDLDELLTLIGREHKGWLEQLWQGCAVEQEPILTSTGKILAEPVFWFKKENQSFACFGSKPLNVRVRHNLEDAGIKIISPGEDWELAG